MLRLIATWVRAFFQARALLDATEALLSEAALADAVRQHDRRARRRFGCPEGPGGCSVCYARSVLKTIQPLRQVLEN